eukprot:4161957-Prymnesium_polylepis.1
MTAASAAVAAATTAALRVVRLPAAARRVAACCLRCPSCLTTCWAREARRRVARNSSRARSCAP